MGGLCTCSMGIMRASTSAVTFGEHRVWSGVECAGAACSQRPWWQQREFSGSSVS